MSKNTFFSARTWLGCLLAFSLCACATHPEPLPPEARGGWDYLGATDYEKQYPGMGRSERYRSALGWLDIYRYNLGRRDWQEGVADPQFVAHFEDTVAEVRHHAARGAYQGLAMDPVREVRIGEQRFRALRFFFFRDGQAMRSVTYLTVHRGQLLKLRVTMGSEGDIDMLTQLFIARLLQAPSTP